MADALGDLGRTWTGREKTGPKVEQDGGSFSAEAGRERAARLAGAEGNDARQAEWAPDPATVEQHRLEDAGLIEQAVHDARAEADKAA